MRYLSAFVSKPVGQLTLHAHASAPSEALAVLEDTAERTQAAAARYLDVRARSADVYLHATTEALRSHSCAGREALAYYDGAIHLATDGGEQWALELAKSLRHESVHHVLIQNGIGRPLWLQESLAMFFANETPGNGWLRKPIALADMVELFPAKLDPEQETTFYGQAAAMRGFLARLCPSERDCRDADLVLALLQGRAMPETLFEWAISERAPELAGTSPRALWDDYATRGDFSHRVAQFLSARRMRPSSPR